MAICEYCNHEMSDDQTIGCVAGHYHKMDDGVIYEAIPYTHETQDRCHDCNVKIGGFHHLGCDMEKCPKCDGQLITCGHLKNKHYIDMRVLWNRR